jgi:hypothetical protein
MKEVLAKNLKVGDVIYDTPRMIRKFKVVRIKGIYMFVLELTNSNIYNTMDDGTTCFSHNVGSPWYMED